MGWLAFTIVYGLVVVAAIRRSRENRRRGIAFNWPKALATAGGAVLVTLLGCGILLAVITLGEPVVGLIAGAVALVFGLVGLVYAVNRRWPPPPDDHTSAIDRKGVILLSAFLGVVTVALACQISLAARGSEGSATVAFLVVLLGGAIILKLIALRWRASAAP
jgi:hypothetical protein